MRRFLAILLLALLPLQFSWAAVASYCRHEPQADAAHLGHHEHKHHADADHDAEAVADLDADPDAPADLESNKAPGATDLDCGHCHSSCGVMLTLPAALLFAPGAAPPSATLDEAGGAHAPARPERPQWLPLA